MVTKLKKNDDAVFHCLMFWLSWNCQEKLPDECLPCIREALDLCAKTNKWTLHKSCVSNNQISFVVQSDPETSVEKVFFMFQKSATVCLIKNFPTMKNKKLWSTESAILSVDQSDLERIGCIREHLPCKIAHVPNKKTAARLIESEREKDAKTFESPLEMFKYLGLPTTCLPQSSQKVSKKTSKKRVVKKRSRIVG